MKGSNVALTGLLLAFTVACGTQPASRPADSYTGAGSDVEHFASFEAAVRSADAVAFVSVVGSAPGRTVTVSTVTLPFTNVTMKVLEAAKGVATGAVIVVEQTGGATPNGTLVSDTDPPYRTGTTHLLLLRSIPAGFRIISSVGRYDVVGGAIRRNEHADFPNPFVGKTATELITWARQLR